MFIASRQLLRMSYEKGEGEDLYLSSFLPARGRLDRLEPSCAELIIPEGGEVLEVSVVIEQWLMRLNC